MSSFTFNTAQSGHHEITGILSDYLALDRARFWRRLLVVRFGLLAPIAFVVARLIPGLSAYGHWIPALLFLTPPAWACVAEIRLARRLSHRLDTSDDVRTYTVVMETDAGEDCL